MKNILILTSGYCGKATANGICTQHLAAALEKQGANVYVVSADREKIEKNASNGIISVHRKSVVLKTDIFHKVIRFIKSRILYRWTPKYDKKIAKQMLAAARFVIKDVQIDAVLSVYFPLEACIVGARLKRENPRKKFILYELDSVSDGIAGGMPHNKKLLFSYRQVLSRIYKWADMIAIMKPHESGWLSEFARFSHKMTLVDLPILIDAELPLKSYDEENISFLYAGVLDEKYRSPELLIQAFGEINSCEKWQLHFYSKGCESQLSCAADTNANIFLHGYVEQQVLNNAIASADVLICIGNKVSNSLPSKVITYMSYGKPIIHFSLQPQDVCHSYLRKYPLALILPCGEDKDSAAKKITSFVQCNLGKTVSFAELSTLFAENIPSYSARLLLKCIDGEVIPC